MSCRIELDEVVHGQFLRKLAGVVKIFAEIGYFKPLFFKRRAMVSVWYLSVRRPQTGCPLSR